MNNKNIAIGASIIIGLIGLGWITHQFLKDEEVEEPDHKDSEITPSDQILRKPIQAEVQDKSKTEMPIPSGSPAASIPRRKKEVGIRPKPMPASRPAPPSRKPRVEDRKREPLRVTDRQKVEKIDIRVNQPKADEFPLRKGSKGPKVERLNVWLTRNYGWSGKITDDFDDSTEHKLVRMTRKKEVDEKTYRKMRMERPVFEQKIVR